MTSGRPGRRRPALVLLVAALAGCDPSAPSVPASASPPSGSAPAPGATSAPRPDDAVALGPPARVTLRGRALGIHRLADGALVTQLRGDGWAALALDGRELTPLPGFFDGVPPSKPPLALSGDRSKPILLAGGELRVRDGDRWKSVAVEGRPERIRWATGSAREGILALAAGREVDPRRPFLWIGGGERRVVPVLTGGTGPCASRVSMRNVRPCRLPDGHLFLVGYTCGHEGGDLAVERWKPHSSRGIVDILPRLPGTDRRPAFVALAARTPSDAWVVGSSARAPYLAHFDGRGWKIVGDGPAVEPARGGAVAPDGTLWVATSTGLWRRSPRGRWSRSELPSDSKGGHYQPQIAEMLAVSEQEVWLRGVGERGDLVLLTTRPAR